jgi:hypothetical protein
MPIDDAQRGTLRRFRIVLGLFIAGLVLSGLTAFPLLAELDLLSSMLGLDARAAGEPGGLAQWVISVRGGLADTYGKYPWMAYGTDWLAFAHIVIAVFFVGPWLEPWRNLWVLRAGLIASGLVIVLALVCGEIRGIPWGWRAIDCSFGVFGAIPLAYCVALAKRLEPHT